MSFTTVLVLAAIAWISLQYLIPGALSYYFLWRDEMRAEAADPAHIHPRHLFTGA
jgi:hypothetical protein